MAVVHVDVGDVIVVEPSGVVFVIGSSVPTDALDDREPTKDDLQPSPPLQLWPDEAS